MWQKGCAIKTKKRSCCHVYRGPSFFETQCSMMPVYSHKLKRIDMAN